MKKLHKLIAISLVGIALASCEAKCNVVSNADFKNNILTKVEAKRVDSLNGTYEVSIRTFDRNLETMAYTSKEFSLDSKNYSKLLAEKLTDKTELTVKSIDVTNGKIVEKETEDGVVFEEQAVAKEEHTYTIGSYSYKEEVIDPDSGEKTQVTKFKYTIKEDSAEVESSDFDPSDKTVTEATKVAFIDKFFNNANVAVVLNQLKTRYNGYIDEIKSTLDDADIKKEILSASTNYVYRYLNLDGFHEFVISKSNFSIDRVGFRISIEAKEALTTSLSGF